jgi:hypothetical protein
MGRAGRISITGRGSPWTWNPESRHDKHAGQLCAGFQIHTEDGAYQHGTFRPWRLVALAFKALRQLRPDQPLWGDSRAALFINLVPVLVMVLAVVVLGESFLPLNMVSAGMIILSVLGFNLMPTAASSPCASAGSTSRPSAR